MYPRMSQMGYKPLQQPYQQRVSVVNFVAADLSTVD